MCEGSTFPGGPQHPNTPTFFASSAPSLLLLLPSKLHFPPLSHPLNSRPDRPLTPGLPHLLWVHQCQEYRGGHGPPGDPGNQELLVHLGTRVHPVAETPSSNQE